MKKWLKRLAIAVAGGIGVLLLIAAVVAWRATRVPSWYATAVDQTPTDDVADAAINRRFVPLQNWLARTSTGDLAAKPDSEKVYTLTLTQDEVNALLAKVFDHIRGDFENYRVELQPGEIHIGCTWTAQGRTVSVSADVEQPDGKLPTVTLGGVRLGNQSLPVSLVTATPAKQLRATLEAKRARGKTPKIDDQDAAPGHTAEAYYGRLALDLLAGRSVSPYAFLTGRLQGDDWIATRITQMSVSAGQVDITFRMATPPERAELIAEIAGPLPGS